MARGEGWSVWPTTSQAPSGRFDRASAGFLAATLLVGAVAIGFGLADPPRNGWAAAALVGALVLGDASQRLAAHAGRRSGTPTRFTGMPSLALPASRVAGLGGAVFLATLALWPSGFPIVATGFAGLVAMVACARLALARILLRTARAEERLVDGSPPPFD